MIERTREELEALMREHGPGLVVERALLLLGEPRGPRERFLYDLIQVFHENIPEQT